MVLLSLEQLFATGEYGGPAILAATIATLLMMMLRRLGLPSLAAVLMSGAALAWFLVLTFRPGLTFFLLPTPAAMAGVFDTIARAYAHSQIDYAPVPTRTGYVALMVIAFWAMATIGEIATFRWRRPLLGAMGPIALFALVLVVGTNAMGNLIVPFFLAALLVFLGLESSHRLRTWGRWVTAWRDRGGFEPDAVGGALARRMGTACVVVALAAPIFLPSIGQGVLAWRNSVGNGTFGNGTGSGFPASASVDPLVSIKSEFLDQTEMELFRVTSRRPLYWRLVTLSQFNGLQWTAAGEPDTEVGEGPLDLFYPPSADSSEVVDQRFELTGLAGRMLPAAYQPSEIRVEDAPPEDLEFDPVTADLQLQTPIEQGMSYEVTSVVPKTSYDEMVTAEPGVLGGEYRDTGLVNPEVNDLLARWTRNADTPFERLLAIQRRLRGFEYSTTADNEASSDYLARFLLETRAGYCQQFATAFAVLARMLGMETRVSVGFLPGSTSAAAPDEYVVRGTDAHAWPEVYFQDFGWISFEPTPREVTTPPGYTVEGGGNTPVGVNLRAREDQPADPRSIGRGGNLQDFRDPAADGGRGRDRAERSGPRNQEGAIPWETAFGNMLRVLLGGAVTFLSAVPLLKELRRKRRYARAAGNRGRAAAAFFEFEDAAADLAAPRRPAESAVAYVTRIAGGKRVPRTAALRLAGIFEAAQYAPREIAANQASEAQSLARQLRRTLWNEATWWQRAGRLFSPTRLLGRTS